MEIIDESKKINSNDIPSEYIDFDMQLRKNEIINILDINVNKSRVVTIQNSIIEINTILPADKDNNNLFLKNIIALYEYVNE